MPALVKSRLGSLAGTRGALGTMVCPRARKKSRKPLRIWSPVTREDLSAVPRGGNLRPPGSATIRARVLRVLRRRGVLLDAANDDATDPLAETSLALAGITSAAVQGRSALGPRAGARVLQVGRVPGTPWVTTTGIRQAHLDGFDLHANVAVAANNRDGLEQLARDVLRP